MIKLNNVNKTYVSKYKQKVDALKDINLEIADRGLVLILGKSGSGKSTLLNILGGLDSATSGEILIDGESFADFKQADYDNYRNRYVGFVFQEFNLLNDFNVEGNVALALQLSKEKEVAEKVINALQAVGLSSHYLTRKIDELSGGEKQRVAIARAIVKESKLILADEPTGNLDSETGASIWDILKNLSKSKLVIIVTHDRESAEKYGDRIIEISDGAIISDSGAQSASQIEEKTYSSERKSLSNAVCFRMGANNLMQRKVKSVSVILLAVFTIFAVLLTQILLCFSSEKTIAKFVIDNGIDYIELTQGKLRYGNEFRTYGHTLNSTIKYIEENSACIKNGFVESKQDILDMGLSFVGEAFEPDDKSYYLTTSGLQRAYYSQQSYIEIDGEAVKLIKEKHPVEFIAGKKVDTGGFHTMDYTVAGVIDISKCNPLIADVFPDYFAKETFGGNVFRSSNQNASEIPEINIQFGDVKYNGAFQVENSLSAVISGDGKILTEQGLQELDGVTLADGEIALSYAMYAKMFDASPKWSYISTDFTEVISMPEQIGQIFSLKFYDYETGELIFDTGELKIAGIVFPYQDYEPKPNVISADAIPKFTAGENTVRKIHIALSNQRFIVKVAGVENLHKFLVKFRNEHEGYVLNAGEDASVDYAGFVYGFEQNLYLFKIIFSSIAVLLSVILLLLVINLISFSILNRKKEIGILSALGATNRDITKIFLIETLLIAVVTFVFNLVAIIVASVIFNNLFSSMIILSVPLLRIDIFTVITLITSSFGLLLLAALIPLRKIIKLKPIDAIKNL